MHVTGNVVAAGTATPTTVTPNPTQVADQVNINITGSGDEKLPDQLLHGPRVHWRLCYPLDQMLLARYSSPGERRLITRAVRLSHEYELMFYDTIMTAPVI